MIAPLNKKLMYALLICMMSLSGAMGQTIKKTPVDYVDNFIGVRDMNTSCVLGPQLPNASINPSPHTNPGRVNYDMDGYIMGNPIRGFAQLHVSGTGWGKYGQVFLSPQTGLATGAEAHDSEAENETAKPYEYRVTLKRYGIRTEVTPSEHSAIYKFTFPETDSAVIMLDIAHNITDIATAMRGANSRFENGNVTFTSNDGQELKGFGTYTGGFSDGPYNVYFVIRLSKNPISKGTWINDAVNTNQLSEKWKQKNDRLGAYVQYKTTKDEVVFLKVGISLKSVDQATYWLDNEIPDWNYAKVKNAAIGAWNKNLSKIVVTGGTETEKVLFYTAAYHASVMPRDKTNDSKYFDMDVPVWDDHLAVWDTWRTLYPLKVLTDPEMVSGTIQSFIARHKKTGHVKDAYVAGREMNVEQGGNDVDNIIVDAYVKGVKGVDWNEAYKLIKFHADSGRNGISYNKGPDSSAMYKELGWIPAGKMSNSVTLEYAYNDFCAAQMAKGLGKMDDYKKYLERSGKWINLWNPDAESDGFKGFIVPRRLGSGFVPIDLKKNWGSWKDYFYEGSSWTYSYFVPHDFEKLVELSGGKENFSAKLKHAFENDLIDYGNEPAFLAVHAFHYSNRSDLASYYARKVMARFTTMGGKENDDSGAMSSWYIFSAMGFFPNAGQNIYYLTGSTFPEITLTLGNGKKLNIISKNVSDKNIYIQSVTINGIVWNKSWFTHEDIANGGRLEFVMGDKVVIQ